ncbi:MAG: molybdopterin-guanine dinucleotide biosynthesis protein B, partial [Candidatus Hadarchaeaceae archaeon]
RGYRVATVKHVVERGFSIDRPGKDTWRHARAGARVVVSLAPRELATIERQSAKLEEVLRRLEGSDFVIIEGFKGLKNLAKIVAARSGTDLRKLTDEFTIASVGARKAGLPVFEPEQMKKLADLVERRVPPVLPEIDCEHCGYTSCREFGLAVLAGKSRWHGCPTLQERVVLTVDGKRVFLNPFMQNMIAGAIVGILSSLKGAKGERIELKVVKRAG